MIESPELLDCIFSTENGLRMMYWARRSMSSLYAANTGKKDPKSEVTFKGVNGLVGPDVLLAARDPKVNPETTDTTRVFVFKGALWENRVEDNSGWFFTRAGDGYAALRIAGDQGLCVVPSPFGFGHCLDLVDIWAPVVIQAGQAEQFGHDFESFKVAVKARPFTYKNGKLTYTAIDGKTYEYWSNSLDLPTIDGKPLELNPPFTYDFPYLKMARDADTAIITYPGYPDLKVNIGSP